MPQQLHLEGPALEPLLQQARAQHGEQVRVVSAQRVRSGGFAGFFSREHFELTIDVSTGTAVPGEARPSGAASDGPARRSGATSGATSGAASGAASGPADAFADLLAAADGADRADGGSFPAGSGAASAAASAALDAAVDAMLRGDDPGHGDQVALGARRPGRPVSTESNGFDDMLAALQAQLLGIEPGAEVTVPSPATEPTTEPTAAATTEVSPWQPVVLHDDTDGPSPVGTSPLPAVAPIKVAPSAPVTPVSPAPFAGTVLIGPRRGQPVDAAAPAATGTVTVSRTVTQGAAVSTSRTVVGTTTTDVTPAADLVDVTVADERPTDLPDVTLADVTLADVTLADVTLAEVTLADVTLGGLTAPGTTTPAVTVPGTVLDTEPCQAATALQATDLVALGRLVGADPTTAAVAAAEVATSGCTSLRLALPMLATALAEEVAEPDGTDASADVGAGPTLSAAAGDLVLVVGSPDRVRRAAQDVADELGTAWVARWSDEAGTRARSGTPTVGEGRRLQLMRARARRDDMPLVVEVADHTLRETVTPRRAGTGRTDLIRSTAPDLVVLAVDADSSVRRQAAVSSRVADACEQAPLLLSLVGCARASAPLVHTSWPVVLLDGRPATVGTWTGVLLDALRWAENG